MTDDALVPTRNVTRGLLVGLGIGIVGLGLLWLVVFYVSQNSFPLPSLGAGNLLAGFVVVVAGVALVIVGATRPRTVAAVAPTVEGTNVFAILSLVFAFVAAVPAVVLGHIALSQISRTGQQGRGLATAGLAIGYVAILIAVVFLGMLVAAR